MQISNPVVNAQYYKETYSDQDISELCEIGNLSPDDVAKFHEELEHFAAICRWETSKRADLPRSSDVARDLRKLIKRIDRLDDGLENLPDEAAYRLRVALTTITLSTLRAAFLASCQKTSPHYQFPYPRMRYQSLVWTLDSQNPGIYLLDWNELRKTPSERLSLRELNGWGIHVVFAWERPSTVFKLGIRC